MPLQCQRPPSHPMPYKAQVPRPSVSHPYAVQGSSAPSLCPRVTHIPDRAQVLSLSALQPACPQAGRQAHRLTGGLALTSTAPPSSSPPPLSPRGGATNPHRSLAPPARASALARASDPVASALGRKGRQSPPRPRVGPAPTT